MRLPNRLPRNVRSWSNRTRTGERAIPVTTQSCRSTIEFCCGAQRASLVAYGRRPMGGLGETALRYEPQTSKNTAQQHEEAHAQQRADGRATSQFNRRRSARASQRSYPRISAGARGTDRDVGGVARYLTFARRSEAGIPHHAGERNSHLPCEIRSVAALRR